MSRETFAAAFDVSRETLDRLSIYADLLNKWNGAINLVAKPTLRDLWSRHFFDSAQLLDYVPDLTGKWVDIGSGAGFPGLVVAIMRPDLEMTLVESDRRKSVFLSEVARETATAVSVRCDRVENVELQADVISARALAPMPELLALARPLLAPDGVALFLKGENVENELTDANRLWHTVHTKHVSRVDPRGSVIAITEFHRRTDA